MSIVQCRSHPERSEGSRWISKSLGRDPSLVYDDDILRLNSTREWGDEILHFVQDDTICAIT